MSFSGGIFLYLVRVQKKSLPLPSTKRFFQNDIWESLLGWGHLEELT